MERKAMARMLAWKNKKDRMPMILQGARQVGKTWLVRQFGGQCYRNVVYVNLETNRRVASLFEEDIEPSRILGYLESHFGERIVPGETLVVLDEIQSCERALTALKYFQEQTPEYHVVAAGSLLGVAINREKFSFPVGKVDSLTLYPLDFEEFLWALGRETLCTEIRRCFDADAPMPLALHGELLELYRRYLVVGGMPGVVRGYVEAGSLVGIEEYQRGILDNYIADMAKYSTPTDSVRIRACYNSIPSQLAKDNRKFMYKVVQNGGSAALFGVSIEWLVFAGVVLKCGKTVQGLMPVSAYAEMPSFKLYMADVGLLVMKSGMAQSTVLSDLEANSPFIGAIAENYVAVALATNGYPLFYWQTDNTAEIDFLIQKESLVIPVEVKSGLRTKSRSLSVYREKYAPEVCIRISMKNFGFENGIRSIPLYAVFCI
jgi:predicted AAA+ superfamily ATPase